MHEAHRSCLRRGTLVSLGWSWRQGVESLSASRVLCTTRGDARETRGPGDSLRRDLFRQLARSSAGDLQALVLIVFARLPLDGGAQGLGAAVEVAYQVRVGGEARLILGEEGIECDLELELLEGLVAKAPKSARTLSIEQ